MISIAIYILIGIVIYIFTDIDVEIGGYKVNKNSYSLAVVLLWPLVLIIALKQN